MRARSIVLVVASIAVLAGCGRVPVPKLPERKPDTMTITIYSEEGANGGAPTPVDVVFVKGDLVQSLTGMSARDWFVARGRLIEQHKDDLFVRDYVLNPGSATSAAFRKRKDAEAVFVFAGYAGDEDFRYQLDRRENYVIRLGANAYTAEATK